jgi:alkanesulfonate monooxygenase SsuD/methylene tetrahydromethanopterin reductase-like flavin-dependent oxidoreductase (luciferase family)
VTDLRFGIALWPQQTPWQPFIDAARLVDRLRYDTLWTWDHLYSDTGGPHQPIFEGWTTLGAWATATEHARLGLMTGANTFRNPGLVAKSAITLDHASGGRAILGMGGGWFALEHEAYGIDFGGSKGERLAWLDESVGIMRRLLDGETVTHDGPRYHTNALVLDPTPVQPRLPILIGGVGERKTLRTVAKYADMWNAIRRPVDELRHKIAVLEEHCAAIGRNTSTIEKTLYLAVSIRDDPVEARRVYASAMALNESGDAQVQRAWCGPPQMIAEAMRPYIEIGFRHLIVDLPFPFDHETVERLIGEVKPLLDD